MNLTVDNLEFCKMVWKPIIKDRQQTVHRVGVNLIHFVDDGLDIIEMLKSFENFCKLITIYPTVVKEYSINHVRIKVLACLCKPLTMAR